MAEQAENPTPAPTSLSIRYVSSVPTSNGNISGQDVTDQAEHYSLYQLQINPDNPNQAALLPAPGADGKLAASFNDVLAPAYQINGLPKPGQEFIKVDKPTMVELIEGNWKIIDMGKLRFSDTPVPALNVFGEAAPQAREQAAQAVETEGLAREVTSTPGATRTEAAADLDMVANQAEQGPDAGKAAYADELRDKSQALPSESTADQQPAAEQQLTSIAAAVPGATDAPTVDPVGEVQIQWKQKGDEVAPLMEMRAYLDQLKDAGVAVGAMKMERGEDGKLTGSFGVSYDPESNKLAQLEGILQGFKQVGNGLEVVEKPAQAAARRQEVGYDDDYEPTRSKQVKEAFGAKQWDALSANLADVPKTALTVPEQVQQSAGEKRVEQLAEQQGKTKEQVLKEGKSIFDIDTSGNPASAFLKNFYQHLTGNPKTRQTLEVDYDKTRQELQARLLKRAGSAQLDQGDEQVKQAPQGQVLPGPGAPAVAAASAAVPGAEAAPEQLTPAKAPAQFQASDVPQKVLASLGLSAADLKQNGQLQKLLNGQKTDLLPMQVAGKDGEEAVKFEGKMVLHREADGTATLKLELPQEKLVIPNEIGGQPFTPEQRQKLETEGNAGLIRGLKDEKGQEYNGYVAVDKSMNKVVILPENKVTLHETIAGVKLTPEQSHDLKEGKAVDLANMASGDGGRKFDGTVQVNAAKACIEIRPAAHELQQRQAPRVEQTAKGARPAVAVETAKVEAPKLTKRAPRL
ncbi:DUF3945 domain-containing protein [Hymenobacter monticola]|uniref:DUF3945 domain-containing protein n=1 Tax=Hymenobacter monticola TaxID=1705399 RepID=A0ABY4BD80_9BACT|nr:DUF3945 domain-containing protein [Hymenobacter monticola]UOE36719.1 DUF3945 domain-containing protein [Hymenobacter monticola]